MGVCRRIDRHGEICRQLSFGHTGLVIAKHPLPLQVRPIDDIVVDDRQPTDSRTGQGWDQRTSDSSCTDDEDARGLEPPLAKTANLREHDMARITLELIVIEIAHRPVLPNPPAPRVVPARASTSMRLAWSTGAGTSCAIRSPRRISNGSWPRLARITFTSPR